MSEYMTALEYVESALEEEKTIEYGDGELLVIVKEDVEIDDVYGAITNIVDNVVGREFEYELIDLMIPYYLIALFTDIKPPIIEEEDGDIYPDYVQCYKIATMLNLEYELTQVSPLVAGYIYLMNQNIWRRLDYHKSEGAYLKRELLDALSAFYQVMDELDEVAEQQKDLDVDNFVSKLGEISQALQEFTQEEKDEKPALTVLDGKSSVDLVVPQSDNQE